MRNPVILLLLISSAALSGCYALDPEMKRVVAERKAGEKGVPSPRPSAPAMPAQKEGAPAEAGAGLPAIDVSRMEILPGVTDLPAPNAPAAPTAAGTPDASAWPAPTAPADPTAAIYAAQAVDAIASAYVLLTLEIGTHERGYIDAYYGPPSLLEAATKAPRDKPALLAAARQLMAKLDAATPDLSDPIERRRAAFLRAQLRAAETRLMMMEGTRFPFLEEAERLFGVRPELKPLTSFDAQLAAVEALVPGEGSLAARVEAFLDRFTIPKDKLKPVFGAAIARCRGRTAAHVTMPEQESFDLQFVTGKSWSGYNYYQGGYHSIIQINTDLPIRLSRALDLGCHEGYPGHHLLNMKLEEQMVKARGWTEFSVYPLYSPQSLIAEGSANYGIDLAFPDNTRPDTERDVLMPLAGIAPPGDDRYWKLNDALKALQGARLTIAQQYLDGVIDRPTAVALTQKYLLVSPKHAEQSVAFTDQYRSYVINYGIGEEMVRAFIERGGPDRDESWRRMTLILSEPTLPADLLAP
ncbi:hypothetical protein [Sphingopyxis flava]|uniref:DUF885 domain-containing protein n=1 Tax=Sphingopyxis flava TaxID=1507287 RepID=A0A1T5E3X7_9SPHN|nr:hypothetical protein [Sphingopyxis flava]SKB78585.1 hypothetical protein SAMN06295937_101866 [Sphingopyxis flava]